MPRIVLHDYWRSSSAYRVRIALNLTGLPYARVEVNLAAGAQALPAHLALNPQGLVPVLEIDGLRLTQSLAILDYLEETRGPGFLPAGPADRARVRALAHAIAMDIQPVCNLRVARHAAGDDPAAMAAWMGHFITLGLAGVEGLLQGGSPFCHGDRPSLADICLVPQVYNARRWGVDLAAFPRLTGIADRAGALPAFAAAHPDQTRPDT
ncbi:maleylacetoacetate isomerase [Tabrizicola sp. TH137]|uniref:maleylacetoacetate isomerase n=1 Tax=Tabrizicola sp. TH137 TaxID=2067452 RepID=UPI000C7C6F4F|nr:maleylacetoacetate isomerase [Tabrizicola sp. TH137]PLL10406.1 maleylacetoacetate isomerase [Tabrizicola sp. TH137]